MIVGGEGGCGLGRLCGEWVSSRGDFVHVERMLKPICDVFCVI